MRRSTGFAVAALLAFLGLTAAPTSADAAYYAMTRETNISTVDGDEHQYLHLEFTVKGRYITRIGYEIPKRCTNKRTTRSYGDLPVHIRIRRNGRFYWHVDRGSRSFYSTTTFIGHVTEGRIRGRLADKFGSGYLGYNCGSGRGFNDPWVRFVARRQQRR